MKTNLKTPKCSICKGQIELVTCHCQTQPQQRYFCWTCKQHYPLKYGFELSTFYERKVPKGACQLCLEKSLQLTKIWSGKYYCPACLVWNDLRTARSDRLNSKIKNHG